MIAIRAPSWLCLPAGHKRVTQGRGMKTYWSISKAVLAFAALSSIAAVAQPIKLGELNSYKTFPAFLEPYRRGMELAVEEINRGGGVLGRPLELIVRDDSGNPGDAVRVAGGGMWVERRGTCYVAQYMNSK